MERLVSHSAGTRAEFIDDGVPREVQFLAASITDGLGLEAGDNTAGEEVFAELREVRLGNVRLSDQLFDLLGKQDARTPGPDPGSRR